MRYIFLSVLNIMIDDFSLLSKGLFNFFLLSLVQSKILQEGLLVLPNLYCYFVEFWPLVIFVKRASSYLLPILTCSYCNRSSINTISSLSLSIKACELSLTIEPFPDFNDWSTGTSKTSSPVLCLGKNQFMKKLFYIYIQCLNMLYLRKKHHRNDIILFSLNRNR